MNTKEKKTTRVQNKTSQFMFKTSPELIEILNDLSIQKGMSKGGLIEYLLRREFDFLTNPTFANKNTYHATPKLTNIDSEGDIETGRILSKNTRKDWESAFKEMHENGDDKLLIDDVFNDENFDEWK